MVEWQKAERTGRIRLGSAHYANLEEKSIFMFGRIKGRAEKHLLTLPPSSGIKGVTLRPSWLFPPPEDAIHCRTSLQRVVDNVLWPVFSRVAPWMKTPIEDIGTVAVEMAKGKWEDERVAGRVKLVELAFKMK